MDGWIDGWKEGGREGREGGRKTGKEMIDGWVCDKASRVKYNPRN